MDVHLFYKSTALISGRIYCFPPQMPQMYLQPKRGCLSDSPCRLKDSVKPDRKPPWGGLGGDEKDEGRQIDCGGHSELHHPAPHTSKSLRLFPSHAGLKLVFVFHVMDEAMAFTSAAGSHSSLTALMLSLREKLRSKHIWRTGVGRLVRAAALSFLVKVTAPGALSSLNECTSIKK